MQAIFPQLKAFAANCGGIPDYKYPYFDHDNQVCFRKKLIRPAAVATRVAFFGSDVREEKWKTSAFRNSPRGDDTVYQDNSKESV